RGSRPASSSASWLRTRSDNDDVEQMGKRPGAAKQVAGGKSVGCQTRVRMWIAGPGAFGGRGSFPDGDFAGVRRGEGGFGGLVAPMTTFPDIDVLYNAGVALRALHAEDDGLICPEVGGWAENKYRLLALYDKLFSTGM